jgi:putative MATE family efflux protein
VKGGAGTEPGAPPGRTAAAFELPSLTEEELPQVVWQLAWPAVLTMMLQFLNGLVDMFFVGRLGPSALAAVGMGSQVVMLLMGASMAVTTGCTAIVARYAGAGDRATAGEAARQSLLLAIGFSFALGLALWLLRARVMLWMGAAPEVVRPGAMYLALTALGITPYFALLVFIAVFQGLGDMRRPLAIMLVVNGANIAGDCLFIRGWGSVPAMGVAGAGLASSSARVLGAAMAAVWLARTGVWRWGAPGWRPRSRWFARILRIGNPAALQSVLRSLAHTSYTRMLAESLQGTAAVAALSVGIRAEGLGYMPAVAYGRAATTLVGQSLGSGRPDRAERSGWLCTWQSMSIICVLSALFFLLAPAIAGWFSDDPRVLALAISYLRINALGEPFLAFSIVLGGALQGAGDTRFQAVVAILTMWLLRLPVTYWFCLRLGYGAVAAWWTMAGTTVVQGLLIAAWFRRGSWRSTEV